jgi:hypothetical protein
MGWDEERERDGETCMHASMHGVMLVVAHVACM